MIWYFTINFILIFLFQVSGLSEWIGDKLLVFTALPLWLMLFFICLIVAIVTEVASNSATTSLLMPIMAAMVSNCKFLVNFDHNFVKTSRDILIVNFT